MISTDSALAYLRKLEAEQNPSEEPETAQAPETNLDARRIGSEATPNIPRGIDQTQKPAQVYPYGRLA